jgi:hypothetical protein
VINRAGRRHHDVRRPVVPRQVVAQFPAVERAHGLGRAQYRAAERLIGKRGALEMLENKIIRGVGHGADFLDDDILLAQQLVAVEGGLGENVGKDIEGERHVGLEHTRVVGRAFCTGRRVEVAADGLDLFRDLARGAPPRAFEGHVLQEVRDTVFVAAFVAIAGIDPHAERGRFQMRHRFGNHVDAGRQLCQLDAHAAAPSCAARLVARTKRSTAS